MGKSKVDEWADKMAEIISLIVLQLVLAIITYALTRNLDFVKRVTVISFITSASRIFFRKVENRRS